MLNAVSGAMRVFARDRSETLDRTATEPTKPTTARRAHRSAIGVARVCADLLTATPKARERAAVATSATAERLSAKVARSTIYVVFGSRAGLFDAFAKDLWDRTGLPAIGAGGNGGERRAGVAYGAGDGGGGATSSCAAELGVGRDEGADRLSGRTPMAVTSPGL